MINSNNKDDVGKEGVIIGHDEYRGTVALSITSKNGNARIINDVPIGHVQITGIVTPKRTNAKLPCKFLICYILI